VEILIEWCRALNTHTARAPMLIVVTTQHKLDKKKFDAWKQPILKKLGNYRVFDMLQCPSKAGSKKTKEIRESLKQLLEKFKVINSKVDMPDLQNLINGVSYRKQQMIIPVNEFRLLARVTAAELQKNLSLLNDAGSHLCLWWLLWVCLWILAAGVILRFENDATLKDLIIVDISVFYKLLTIINQLYCLFVVGFYR